MINLYMVVHSEASYLLSKEEEPWTYDSGSRIISPDLPFPFPCYLYYGIWMEDLA